MPNWPEPPDHGRKRSHVVMEIAVPATLQRLQLFKDNLEAIAQRAGGQIEAKLYFRVSGDMKRKELELVKLEIEHLARTCNADMTLQSTHTPDGSEQPIRETTRITARPAKG